MSSRHIRLAFAAIAMGASFVGAPAAANAQNLIDFLWGGDEEFGGKRSVVSFSSQFKPGQLIVSFGDRRLYLVTKEGQAISYPIAIPREQDHWSGNTTVSSKRENPSWTPTPTMLKENPKLPSWVPGGHPMNPLGVRALYLGSSTYRIHGTDAPWTIGQAVSKGCIRMFNEDVLDLYPRVPVGAKVLVTWDTFKTGAVDATTASAASVSTSSKGSAPKTSSSKGGALFSFGDDTPPKADKTPASTSSASTSPANTSDDGYTVDNTAKGSSGDKSATTKFGRKVGGGQVSRAAQTTAQAE